ncbi:BNR-4 repeat-containing protein [Brachybacterium sp. J144]|uniref:BNR-4 repeat-containing protein n=1 Tax=Brachybacterium sp. J144 TaxID=3116487 RepID=UPI002E77892B|nr:BNR-4 repeat-containing protein [Brachybacterium sp. J144]MEE1650599.1 BNR-4 repeat-containing protein [Brachybacterium sp. J144]
MSTPEPAPQILNDNGAWCWFQDERALVDPERRLLVVGSIASVAGKDGDRRGGDLDLNVVDLGTGEVQVVTLHEGFESDDHDVPALWLRPDGRWLAVYARHKTDDNTYWRISEVGDPTRWGEERVFDWSHLTDGRRVTYSNIHEIDGRLYCLVRAINDDPCALVSDDLGESWTFAGKLFEREKIGYVNAYARYADGPDGLHVVATDHHPRDDDNAIHHGVISGGRLRDSTGAVVGGELFVDPPVNQDQLTTILPRGSEVGGALLSHAWTTDLRVVDGVVSAVMTARADHPGWPEGAAITGPDAVRDADGNDVPVPDLRLLYARLGADGQWTVSPLAAAGPGLLPHEQDYSGLAALDPYDADALVASTPIDPRDGRTLAHHELFRGRTADGGLTWSWTPITEDSAVDNLRPILAPGDPATEHLLWFRGDMDSSQRFDCEVVLASRPR